MSNASFYKSNDAHLMAALDHHQAEIKVISKKAAEFADKFGAEAICFNDARGYRICSLIKFPHGAPERSSRVWTKPDEKLNYGQRPKKSVVRATPEEKAEMARLEEIWKDFPTDESSYNPVLSALGINYGDLFFNTFQLFVHAGFAYVGTGAKVCEHMVEILGSEFEAAYQAQRAEHEEAKRLAEEAKRVAT